MLDLAQETQAFQAMLEHVRAATEAQDDYSLDADRRPDEQMVAELREDLEKARSAMSAAWLEQQRTDP
jgi:hypothetical protein